MVLIYFLSIILFVSFIVKLLFYYFKLSHKKTKYTSEYHAQSFIATNNEKNQESSTISSQKDNDFNNAYEEDEWIYEDTPSHPISETTYAPISASLIHHEDPPASSYFKLRSPLPSTTELSTDWDLQTIKNIVENSGYRKSKYSSYYIAFDYILSDIPRAIIEIDNSASAININISGFSIDTNTVAGYCHPPHSYVVIDIETTGLVPGKNKIIQITAIRFSNHKADSIFSTYINPSCKIPPESTKIHGITDDMVNNAPKFHQILPSLKNFIGNNALVGHNLIFDIKFLRKFGYDHYHQYYDTLELSKYIDTDIYSHTLSSACEYHNIISSSHHNSNADALMTALLFQCYFHLSDTNSTLNMYRSLQKSISVFQENKKNKPT